MEVICHVMGKCQQMATSEVCSTLETQSERSSVRPVPCLALPNSLWQAMSLINHNGRCPPSIPFNSIRFHSIGSSYRRAPIQKAMATMGTVNPNG